MALKRLVIKNYRSIKNLDIELGRLNAIIGPNNAGKSNILRALNIVLGETWPTRPFSDKDFHGQNRNSEIEVMVTFDRPLTCAPDVCGFCLRYSADEGVDYVPVDENCSPCVWSGFRGTPKRISNDMRSEVTLLYLGLDRTAEKQVRASQWTLYGKLLKQIEGSMDPPSRQKFSEAVTSAFEKHVRGSVTNAQRIIDDFVRRQTGLTVELDFKLLDPHEVLKGIRPYVIDALMTFDPEDVGAGVQSALAVGIAKAYAEIVRRPLILAIEEPELYLHPHGCRHFYKLLSELSSAELQIIYTTHERSFVNAGEVEQIHVVNKTDGKTSVISGASVNLGGEQERLKLQSKFNERLNEVFFASSVVLVEGDPDEIACRCALEKQGLELDRHSISVMPLGGLGEVHVVAQLLVGLSIPCFALIDEDPHRPETAKTRQKILQLLGDDHVFLQRPNLEGLFEFG